MTPSVGDRDWFRQNRVKAVFDAIARDGYEARIVGGAVRNALMGLPVGEIDFATTAPPDEIIRLSVAAGLKPVPTGIEHGTVTIVVEGTPFEVTTLRRDVETDGRRAKVSFTRDWAEDAARRDFTINALYADADGRVFDPLGGIADLRSRRVRFIGSPEQRIREDYLRILRFFRFTANYSAGPLDAEGLAACIDQRAGLAKLSPERVRAELLRILVTRTPMAALEPMKESGLLISILGGVVRLAHFENLAQLEARLDLPPAPIRRLAALAIMIEEDAARLSARLRLSNAETARLQNIAALEPILSAEGTALSAKEALYRLDRDKYQDRVLVAWATAGGEQSDSAWRTLFSLPDCWKPPVMPVKAADLTARGMKPGPALGKSLREIECAWINSGFALSKEELLENLLR
jgi:poly(A) polymerase